MRTVIIKILIEICNRKTLVFAQGRLAALANYRHLCFLAFAFPFLVSPVLADSSENQIPIIAILIDDMGDDYQVGIKAILLTGNLSYSFLPNSPHTTSLATIANDAGKEVLLHLPMESIDEKALSPNDLTLDMTETQFVTRVEQDLLSVPMAVGVNNHKGSLLTQHPGHMVWLMRVLKANGNLFFIDSLTSVSSIAGQVATEVGIANTTRNVFLDHYSDMESINENYEKLIRIAKKTGAALAIAHPRKNTLKYLEKRLVQIEADGVRLVSVSEIIKNKNRRKTPWRASLSLLPKAMKN